MPVAAREAKVFLTLHGEEFRRGLHRAQRDMEGFRNAIGGMLKALALAATVAFAGIVATSIKAAAEEERAFAALDQAIITTGGVVGYTSAQLAAMAGEFQKVSRYGDEAIMGMMAQLLTFTKITGPIFHRAVQATLDLSTRFGQDLPAAALALGKALQDPIRYLSMLGRSGITFTEQQSLMIKKLWESGEAAKAQGMILDELAIKMGGAASRDAATFTGRLAQLKNVIGDVQEKIGFLLIPKLTEWATLLRDFFLKNEPAITGAFKRIFDAIEDSLGKLKEWGVFLRDHGDDLLILAKNLGGVTLAIYGIATAVKVLDLAMHVSNLKLILLAIAALSVALGFVVDKLRSTGEETPDSVQAMIDEFHRAQTEIKVATEGMGQSVAEVGKAVELVQPRLRGLGPAVFPPIVERPPVLPPPVVPPPIVGEAEALALLEREAEALRPIYDEIRKVKNESLGWNDPVIAEGFDAYEQYEQNAVESTRAHFEAIRSAGLAAYGALAQGVGKLGKIQDITHLKVLRIYMTSLREGLAAFIDTKAQEASVMASMALAQALYYAFTNPALAAKSLAAFAIYSAKAAGFAIAAAAVRGAGPQGTAGGGETFEQREYGEPAGGTGRGPSARIVSAGAGGPTEIHYHVITTVQGNVIGPQGMDELVQEWIIPRLRTARELGQIA